MENIQKKKGSEAARPLGKLGGAKGGKARAEALTPEERQRIGREAIAARWDRYKEQRGQEKIPQATHGSPDRPLRIGPMAMPGYVLDDGKRVLSQGGRLNALAMGRGGPGKARGDRLANFMTGKAITPFIPRYVADATTAPMFWRGPNGKMASGYEATVWAEICAAVLEARKAEPCGNSKNT